ncbi:MAG: ribose-phosphate pyrophosphokinase, partial [Clostridiales bacterium]|nr:ribose-phosphate pyrophosphokinase [Clostridiales bacterium]
VKGKRCLIVDDMIDTAGTITQGAKALVDVGGASDVYACCTHPVLSGPAMDRLQNSVIKKLFLLDTIELPQDKRVEKFITVSVAPIFAEAIAAIFADLPVSKLYD